ncbi:hypothetical protein [Streptomyces sp. NBC_00539]|uniref:hypothetical protein n=1 Tax=Streptomyces sp. NBC_00539 TaxID=2975770 RepID=UPI002E80D681|nr:hypothetical protein [Streptomyces sp. NBC_00539]WUC65865.1 hypothetical protein OG861_17365 [Streptomyces sp. NBC_00539]
MALPVGHGLQFESEAGSIYQLTVLDVKGGTVNYPGNLSGNSLSFMNVDLASPATGSTSAMWVAVTASSGAASGNTNLVFTIGDHVSGSSVISVSRS